MKAKLKRWALGAERCQAQTKSEARAEFKRRLGLPRSGRLPKHSHIARLP